nr:lasso peptide biosynthesis B2 protein [Sphingobium sp.]
MARADLYWCEVGSHIVILDVARDRYLQLPQHLVAALHLLRQGGTAAKGDADPFAALARIGLCDEDFRGLAAPSSIAVPAHDLWSRVVGARCDRPMTVGAALVRIVAARAAVRAIPLRILMRWVRRLQARPSKHVTREAVAARTALFVQARQLLPARGACLPDSIALLHFLRARAIACRLVFGVRLEPFEAHCWVQDADAILGDMQERVACFTPILSL